MSSKWPDRHKIRIDAGLSGRDTELWLDDVRLTDVASLDFHADADSMTMVTLTMFADIQIEANLLSEYIEVRVPEKPATWWQRTPLYQRLRSAK